MHLLRVSKVGIEVLGPATTLLRTARRIHPTAGLYEAADLQWWWRTPRSTDVIPKPVWLGESRSPVAAAILTDWGDRVALDPLVLPGAEPGLVRMVFEEGLACAATGGVKRVTVEVDPADAVLRALLDERGFIVEEGGVVEAWLDADARPPMSPLLPGYRLTDRTIPWVEPHHLAARNGPHVERRLRETSIYRPDLDLAILDAVNQVAAYGLFWFDPATATGLVEPLRTEDAHQRRGLARHVLTSGIERLAALGATRIKICFEPDNVAARDLYLGVGFRPVRTTIVLAGPVE